MLPFNTFSLPALVAVMTTAPLAGVFAVLYWRFGRRRADAAFAGLLVCGAAATAAVFLGDNVVPAGTASTQVPGAAQWTLTWTRGLYAAGLAAMAVQVHLVLVFCRIAIRRWMPAAMSSFAYGRRRSTRLR